MNKIYYKHEPVPIEEFYISEDQKNADKYTYINMLHRQYKNGTTDHPQHNANPEYWSILLRDINENPEDFEGKNGLDFGCGRGRNVTNMLKLAKWNRVDGIDISSVNIENCSNSVSSSFYVNNGLDLEPLKSDEYDFVMSTITLQHICVHEIRYSLLKDIYRVMKDGGIFSFQMGYGNRRNASDYYDNYYTANGSNSKHDVRITNEKDLIDDLEKIGFKNITFEIRRSFCDGGHPNWIYVRCIK